MQRIAFRACRTASRPLASAPITEDPRAPRGTRGRKGRRASGCCLALSLKFPPCSLFAFQTRPSGCSPVVAGVGSKSLKSHPRRSAPSAHGAAFLPGSGAVTGSAGSAGESDTRRLSAWDWRGAFLRAQQGEPLPVCGGSRLCTQGLPEGQGQGQAQGQLAEPAARTERAVLAVLGCLEMALEQRAAASKASSGTAKLRRRQPRQPRQPRAPKGAP